MFNLTINGMNHGILVCPVILSNVVIKCQSDGLIFGHVNKSYINVTTWNLRTTDIEL